MELLSYRKLEEAGYDGYLLKEAPVKVLQFGEGNFLRAFADYFIDVANERAGFGGKIAMVQPASASTGGADRMNAQDGLYTLYLRGSENGQKIDRKRIISAASGCCNTHRDWAQIEEIICSPELKYIISNTTEAGIVYDAACKLEDAPPASFPAKLTKLLYARWKAGLPGLAILPCELIDDNGLVLRDCVLRHAADWKLEDAFADWVGGACIFCSTLVDRIVPGRVRDEAQLAQMEEENGYRDEMLVVGEVFGVWYIEELPAVRKDDANAAEQSLRELEDAFSAAGANVHFVPEVVPYKKRKVRILNGAHTGFVPGAYLAGFNIVRDCMHDEAVRGYMNRMLEEEVIPVLPLPEDDCKAFAAAVQDRFDNPFVDHQLISITLNSTSKWRARNMPTLLEYVEKYEKLPPCLSMSLAMLIAFYSTDIVAREDNALVLRRQVQGAAEEYRAQDDAQVLNFYYEHKDADDAALVNDVLANTDMWGQDLRQIAGLEETVLTDLALIRQQGTAAAFAKLGGEKIQ